MMYLFESNRIVTWVNRSCLSELSKLPISYPIRNHQSHVHNMMVQCANITFDLIVNNGET